MSVGIGLAEGVVNACQPLLDHDYPPLTGNYRIQPEPRLGLAVSGRVSRLPMVAPGPTASSLRRMGGRLAHRAGHAARQRAAALWVSLGWLP
jgi:hypothetical protein